MTIIIKALNEGHIELAMTLIQNSVPYQVCQYDESGQTALHIAIQKNYLDVTCALLENGANIDAYARDSAYHRMTPMHYAALTGNLVAARLLLNWGADITLENGDGLNPASLALKHGFVAIAKVINQQANYKPKFAWPLRLPLSKKMHNKEQSPTAHITPYPFQLHKTELYQRDSKVVDFLAYKLKRTRQSKL
ncbi:ankyrin repeat domain-containing protein [Candidatus Berkiella cookevillensis]|uniref:Ankyrin repeat domain-containing protein n=1 Tax=Candidatus Berkiella cookevillensis TaxID=437022 RepID=A0A0Q9YSC2_9GAMM|nr:ankyrin repeat domain-containing protein [Candidatus Berkiella cookevillensis]MCS5707524.1 ankyrin repeat domain-containing protein [Candidatus Berkiella cookevillensis]